MRIVFRYTDQVAIDDEVLSPGSNGLIPAKVSDVSSFPMKGDSFSDILLYS